MPRTKANGEGSIIKLPNGKYKAIITLDVIRDERNKVIRQPKKTFTHEKRGECQKWLNEQLNLKQKDMLVLPSETTVKQWLNYWMKKYQKNKMTVRGYEEYETLIKVHLTPAIGNKKVQELKTNHLQELYEKKIEDGKSPQTVKHIHCVINGALKKAVKEEIVFRNVAENCELPKIQRKTINVLTDNEVKKLLNENKLHPLYPLLLLELGTGLRRAELLGLHWSNIDLDNKLLYVEGSVTETKSGSFYKSMPKTKSSIRTIPLPSSVVDELKKHQEKQKNNTHDIVFPNQKGYYMRPSTLTQIFKYVWLKNAKLPQRSFHSLRHTHATQLLAMNVHAKIVQQRLGHSNISTTLDIYSHALPHMQQEASDKINDILNIKPDAVTVENNEPPQL